MTEERTPRAATPSDEEDETSQERLNRNWADILQELRVIQAGTQILAGFLLAAAFQPRFTELDPIALIIYFSLLGAATATTIIALTPVLLHRSLFRKGAKASLVGLGSLLVTIALVGVGITLAGTVLLIVDLVWGLAVGIVAAGAVLLVLLALWVLLPWRVRRGIRR